MSPRGNAAFILAVTLAETGLIAGGTAGGLAPWWFPVALLPVIAARGRQLWAGLYPRRHPAAPGGPASGHTAPPRSR